MTTLAGVVIPSLSSFASVVTACTVLRQRGVSKGDLKGRLERGFPLRSGREGEVPTYGRGVGTGHWTAGSRLTETGSAIGVNVRRLRE